MTIFSQFPLGTNVRGSWGKMGMTKKIDKSLIMNKQKSALETRIRLPRPKIG